MFFFIFAFLCKKWLIIAVESSRVCLQPIRGVDGSDYINADFIHVSFSFIQVSRFVTNTSLVRQLL